MPLCVLNESGILQRTLAKGKHDRIEILIYWRCRSGFATVIPSFKSRISMSSFTILTLNQLYLISWCHSTYAFVWLLLGVNTFYFINLDFTLKLMIHYFSCLQCLKKEGARDFSCFKGKMTRSSSRFKLLKPKANTVVRVMKSKFCQLYPYQSEATLIWLYPVDPL